MDKRCSWCAQRVFRSEKQEGNEQDVRSSRPSGSIFGASSAAQPQVYRCAAGLVIRSGYSGCCRVDDRGNVVSLTRYSKCYAMRCITGRYWRKCTREIVYDITVHRLHFTVRKPERMLRRVPKEDYENA